MTLIPPLLAGIFAPTLLFASGCISNPASISHGMSFATIEDTVQQKLPRGVSRDVVIEVAENEWGLEQAEESLTDASALVYQLRPERESLLETAKHRSYLKFEFVESRLAKAIYINHWLRSELPQGETEIKLWRPTP